MGGSSIASTCCVSAELPTQQCHRHQRLAEALQLHREAASHTLLVAAGQSVPREVQGPLARQSASWDHCKQQHNVDVNHSFLIWKTSKDAWNHSPYKLASQVQERLLVIVVTLGRNLVVLKVLLSVKCDLLGLHLPVLDINLVATQDNRDVLTDSAIDSTADVGQPDLTDGTQSNMFLGSPTEVSVPCGHILVCKPRGNIKHDDSALAMNVVSITKSSKLLLTSCVPAVKAQLATVCGEIQGVHLHSNCCCTHGNNSAEVKKRVAVCQPAEQAMKSF